MSKISIWKRFGDWLRGSERTGGAAEVLPLNAESSMMASERHATMNDVDEFGPLTAREATMQKLDAIENGFTRLVDVLGEVNTTLQLQREQTQSLQNNLQDLPETMNRIPAAVQSQTELVEKLTEEFRDQNGQYAQLREAIKVLPRQTEVQVERLNEIAEHVGQSSRSDAQVLENIQAQTLSIANVGELLQQQDDRLQKVITKQQRDFTLLFTAAVVIGALALIMVGAVMFLRG